MSGITRADLSLGGHWILRCDLSAENVSKEVHYYLTPGSAVHGALLLRCRGAYPLEQTMHMEDVTTLPPYW